MDGQYHDEHQAKHMQSEKVPRIETSLTSNLPEARAKKDLKSISQNLFDTTAWWVLQSISHENGKFGWTGLPVYKNGRTGHPTRMNDSKSSFDVPRLPADTSPFVDLEEYYVLSHFNPSNIRALVEVLEYADPGFAEEQRLLETLGISRLSSSQESISAEVKIWHRFAYQSMTYIFSSVDRLVESFRYPDGNEKDERLLDCAEIEGCIRILRSKEGIPQRIFPSLWVALGNIHASYDDFKSRKAYFDEDYQPQASAKERCHVIDDEKAAHVVAVTLAALNASVPVDGVSCQVLYKIFVERSPPTDDLFLPLHDAFVDDQAIDLATRMVRVWMTRRALEASGDGEADFTTTVMNRIESSSRIDTSSDTSSLDSRNFSRSEVQYCEKSVPGLLLIAWLQKVIFRHWDGKAEINRMSPVAGAIDWLGALGELIYT